MTTLSPSVIRKELTVDLPVERAFELFTQKIASWWPLQGYSILADGEGVAEDVVFEPRVGGRVYEVRGDRQADWATVLQYDPPHRIVLEWRVDPTTSTEVEVTLTATESGTRVELAHGGWERYGDAAERQRDMYCNGWDDVLGGFESAAA